MLQKKTFRNKLNAWSKSNPPGCCTILDRYLIKLNQVIFLYLILDFDINVQGK